MPVGMVSENANNNNPQPLTQAQSKRSQNPVKARGVRFSTRNICSDRRSSPMTACTCIDLQPPLTHHGTQTSATPLTPRLRSDAHHANHQWLPSSSQKTSSAALRFAKVQSGRSVGQGPLGSVVGVYCRCMSEHCRWKGVVVTWEVMGFGRTLYLWLLLTSMYFDPILSDC